jgi:hypothetical protein
MKDYRKAHLLLHRKPWCSKVCICGSEMVNTSQGWVCRRQIQFKEPKAIEVWIPKKPIVVRG